MSYFNCLQALEAPEYLMARLDKLGGGSRGNGFSGVIEGVQLAIAEAAESVDHLVNPQDAIQMAMARQ